MERLSLGSRQYFIGTGIVLAAFLTYVFSLGNGFVEWDDYALIVGNPLIQELSPSSLYKAFASFDPELYVPLTTVSYQLMHALFGASPVMEHALNLLLHILSSLLVWRIALSLTGRTWASIFAALVFALHPINVEAVAWASARKDVLSGFFLFLSFFLYLRRNDGRKGIYAGSILCFLLALLAKVSVLAFPIALLFIDWHRRRPIDRSALLEKIPYVALSLLFGAVALQGKIAQGSFLLEKFLIACRAVTLHLGHLFLPFGLSVLYPYTDAIAFSAPDLFLSLLAVITITVLCLVAWKRWDLRVPLSAWAWFLLFLAPSFLTIARGHNETLDVYVSSDRYAYVAAIGLFLLIGLAFDWLHERWPRAMKGLFALCILLLATLSVRQSLTWRDTESLFRHTIKHHPESYVAHTTIGTELMKRGNIDEALEEYQAALLIREDATTLHNMGQIFLLHDDIERAEIAFRRARVSSPLEADAAFSLAQLLIAQGRLQEALTVLEEAAVNVPGHEGVRLLLQEMKDN